MNNVFRGFLIWGGFNHFHRVTSTQKFRSTPRVGQGFDEDEWVYGVVHTQSWPAECIRFRTRMGRGTFNGVFYSAAKFTDFFFAYDVFEDVKAVFFEVSENLRVQVIRIVVSDRAATAKGPCGKASFLYVLGH